MIGSSVLAQKTGAVPAYIAVGVAAGLHRLVAESNLEQNPENGKNLLLQNSSLAEDNALTAMILTNYQRILDGCSIAELHKTAEKTKATQRVNVI